MGDNRDNTKKVEEIGNTMKDVENTQN